MGGSFTHKYTSGEYKGKKYTRRAWLEVDVEQREKEFNEHGESASNVFNTMRQLCTNGGGQNAFFQLQAFRKTGKMMVDLLRFYQEVAEYAFDQINTLERKSAKNANKKWTKDEDELLIELVTDDDVTDIELMAKFGRSMGAIKTRVSTLVGLNRISQEIAGRFVGTINGEKVEGKIDGTVYKGERKYS